ncbi:MAG: transposase [Deltaproteobacteria bacterium]|nr:transposase [Deltaproteobacteria bacterium]
MARPLRIQYPNAVYHVMNRGLARRPVFFSEKDYLAFFRILQEAWERWQFKIYAYCLMGNHYHLCIQTPEAKISRIMRHINGVYTQYFNRLHRRDGPLFRGRYKSILIESEEYLGQVVRYIHLNPVEKKWVKTPEEYPWSSHGSYLSKERPPWLDTKEMLAWFDNQPAFHNYVLEGNDENFAKLYNQKKWPVILGRETFIERIRKKAKNPTQEHTRKERQFVRPSIQKVLEMVAEELNVPLEALIEGRRGVVNSARKVAAWSLRTHGDYTYRQIADVFGFSNERTVGWVCQNIEKILAKNGKLKRALERIEKRTSQPET